MAEKRNKVMLLIDKSKESYEVFDVLNSLPKAIDIQIIHAGSLRYGHPTAYWMDFRYHGIRSITELRDKLQKMYGEGKIPA